MSAAPVNIQNSPNMAETSDKPVSQRKRGAELEQAIRDACISELACCGYGDLTIESVASRAQTGKASIYRRWSTKQELVMDSVAELMSATMVAVGQREIPDSVSTRDALLDLMAEVSRLMCSAEGDAVRSVMSESLRDASFSGMFQCEFFDPRKVAVIRLLERGVARGEVRPDAVDDLVPDILAGALIHRILIRREVPTKADLARMVDGFILPAISVRSP